MHNNWKTCDLALRFKARFVGPERSGITLAMVWSTGSHGTAGRRVRKRGLHIFAMVFLSFWGAQGAFLLISTNFH